MARRMSELGHPPVSVANRTDAVAAALAAELGCEQRAWASWAAALVATDVVWLCVADDALAEGHRALAAVGFAGAVVQASGSAPHPDSGAYLTHTVWPVQSITQEREPAWERLVCIMHPDPNADVDHWRQLVETYIRPVQIVLADRERRARLHLGAVVTQNFANVLWRLAFEQLGAEDARLLLQLSEAYLERLREGGNPDELQTGPAVRGDDATVAAHRKLLDGSSWGLKVYTLLSSIIAGAR